MLQVVVVVQLPLKQHWDGSRMGENQAGVRAEQRVGEIEIKYP